MAAQREQITIPGRLRVWLADGEVAAPASAVSTMPTGWRDCGFTDTDGTSFATEVNLGQVESHQSDYPTRQYVESRTATIEANLQQWNAENFRAVHGGGTVTEVTPPTTPPTYKFTPPDGLPQTLQACVEVIDGTKHYRYLVPVCTQAEGVEQSLAKAGASTLPLRLTVEGQDGVPAFYMLTDDSAYAPA